jgi:hypothetical protein
MGFIGDDYKGPYAKEPKKKKGFFGKLGSKVAGAASSGANAVKGRMKAAYDKRQRERRTYKEAYSKARMKALKAKARQDAFGRLGVASSSSRRKKSGSRKKKSIKTRLQQGRAAANKAAPAFGFSGSGQKKNPNDFLM